MAQQITIKGTSVTAASELLVADSNSKIPAVDGSQVTAMSGTNVSTGTIATARLDTGTTANKIVVLDGTAKLPAVDGSLLTGLVSYTKSASDPTISTNPSGGVGTEWVNTTSGKQYICTDATAGENVWSSSGSHSGDISPFHFTGESYGFVSGGSVPGTGKINVIQKFPFATQTNSTDHGDLSTTRTWNSGASSNTHGFSHGTDGPTAGNYIDKFAFASNVTATDHGDFPAVVANGQHGGHSSETHGFTSGHGGGDGKTVTKYSFATADSVVDHGDLTAYQKDQSGMSGPTDGYTSGGWNNDGNSTPAYLTSRIDKFAYASNTTASSHGNLSTAWRYGANTSSSTDGFVCGGGTGAYLYSGVTAAIEKISWASNTTASSHGDLSLARYKAIGQSEESYGFISGGDPFPSGSASNVIDKFAYASNVTGTDHADLFTAINYRGGGHQV